MLCIHVVRLNTLACDVGLIIQAIDTVVECQSVGDTNSARGMKREFKLQVEVAQVQQVTAVG